MIIQTGDGKMAEREARGTCLNCDTAKPEDYEGQPCRVCGLVVVAASRDCELEAQARMAEAMQ